MVPRRWLVLLVAVMCAAAMQVARAAEDDLPEIDNNEVLPDADIVRARVDEVSSTPAAPSETTTPGGSPSTPEPETVPPPTTTPQSSPSTSPESTAKPSATSTSSTTGRPTPTPPQARPPSGQTGLSRFLSDIIQIPIAVLRSVGSLLSNTFAGAGAPVNPVHV